MKGAERARSDGTVAGKHVQLHAIFPDTSHELCLQGKIPEAFRQTEGRGHIYTYIYMYIFVYVYIYVYMYICEYMCIHMCVNHIP